MQNLASLKRRQTKSLTALVRRVRAARRLARYVPTAEMLLASAAQAIINERRKRR